MPNELREKIAAQEHRQWACWAKTLMDNEKLSQARIDRWQILCFTPYQSLPQSDKEQDRYWADSILALINQHFAELAKEKKYKSPEEVYDQTMKAKKSGWDDCIVWHKQEGYVQLAEDQSVPDNVCDYYDDGTDFTNGYELAQQDMLKAGWRKVK